MDIDLDTGNNNMVFFPEKDFRDYWGPVFGDFGTMQYDQTKNTASEYGYKPKEDIVGYPSPEAEIGYLADGELMAAYDMTPVIAQRAGVDYPQRIPWQDVISGRPGSLPIVAHDVRLSKGKGTFLLETPEQLARLSVWALTYGYNFSGSEEDEMRSRELDEYLIRNPRKRIGSLLKNARKGEYSEDFYPEEFPHWLVFMPYIETPSPYYTSFRLLTSAFGAVLYGELLYSRQRKDEERPPLTEEDYNDNNRTTYHSLLVRQNSPLFLGARQISSNFARGGKFIRLDGWPVRSHEQIPILEAHGINPGKPEIPESLYNAGEGVGMAFRYFDLLGGSDFMMNQDFEPVYLETNLSPHMTTRDFGVPLPSDPDFIQDHIIARRYALKQILGG